MDNKKPNRFINFFKTYKLLTLTLFLFLIVLPLATIPSIYIYQVASAKPTIFFEKGNKAVKLSKQKYFDITFDLHSIITPDSDGKNGYYVFEYEIKMKDTVNEIERVSFNAQLSVQNDKYSSHYRPGIDDLESNLVSTSSTRLRVPFNYDMDKRILPFMYPKGPRLFLALYFTEYVFGEPFNEVVFVEVPF